MSSFISGPEGPQVERRSRRRGEARRRHGEERRRHGDGLARRHERGGYGAIDEPRTRRRSRRGRGDVRAAIIALLSEAPSNGYQIIQEINARTGGEWRVSSGSVYPTISQLEDEGLIEPADGNGRKVLALTAAGREHAEQNAEHLARIWEGGAEEARRGESRYRELVEQLAAAVRQVDAVGTPAQREEAKKVLTRARQSLYLLLAADADEVTAPSADAS